MTVCLFMAGWGLAWADTGEHVENVRVWTQDDQLVIDADVEFRLASELRSMVEKGVPLYFTADLEIYSPRWWWFDELILRRQLTWRIVYNALTREWRVAAGGLSMPESSLDDALARVRQIRAWTIAPLANLDREHAYRGRLRVRLDTSLLARPFQIDALNSSAWSLATPWKNFSFSISDDVSQP